MSVTLSPVRNLPAGDPATRRIVIGGIDTGAVFYRNRGGFWQLSDPGRPYGPVFDWPDLASARADLSEAARLFQVGFFAICVGWLLRVHSTRAPDVVW